MLLDLLDTEVVLDFSTLSTVSFFLHEGNRCVDYVNLLFDGGNGCFDIIQHDQLLTQPFIFLHYTQSFLFMC